MPEFKNREEYERWKAEKLRNAAQKAQPPKKEEPLPNPIPSVPNRQEGTGMRTLSNFMSDSWEIFKQRFFILITLYLSSIVFFCIALAVFVGAGYALSLSLPEKRTAFLVAGAGIGLIPAFVVMFWGISGFTCAVVDRGLGIREGFAQGWRRVGAFMWLFSLLGFLVTGGFLLLVIPGIIFLVWFLFAQFVLASEDERGMNAILKSKEYVRGNWFDVALKLLVVWLVSVVIGVVPVVGPFLSLAFVPFMMIFINLVYEDLKALKGEGMAFPHSPGEKFKWIGTGTLGYIVMPVVIIALLGAAITLPMLMVLGSLVSKNQQTFSLPQELFTDSETLSRREKEMRPVPHDTHGEVRKEVGVSPLSAEKKPDAVGEAHVVRDGIQETYVLKTGIFSDTRFSDPKRATVEFQIPSEPHSNARRIQVTLDATRAGQHYADGKAINDNMFGGAALNIGEATSQGTVAGFRFIADGGQIFPPKEGCTIIITSPYTGDPRSIFSGEVETCVVHSAGIDRTVSAKFGMAGVPSQ